MRSRLARWLLLAAALALAPSAASGWCRTRTVRQPTDTTCATRGALLAWRSGCVSLHVNPAVTAPDLPRDLLRPVVEEGARAWSGAVCDRATGARPTLQLLVGDDVDAPVGYFAGRSNLNVVTWRPVWGDDEDHDPRAAAITLVTYGENSGVILDMDVELNARSMVRFSADGSPATLDLRTVVTHELGHVLGLAHSGESSAVMYYRAGQGERRRAPTADDVAGLCAAYPPWRATRCEPTLRVEVLEGGGLTCAPVVGRGGRGAALALAVVAAWWWRRRRGRRANARGAGLSLRPLDHLPPVA